MQRADPIKRRKACDDWISTQEVVNSLPEIHLTPKLLKKELPKDLEYRYCIDEVAESDNIELFIEEEENSNNTAKKASLPIDLFQPNVVSRKLKTFAGNSSLPPEDQFLLTKYSESKNIDEINTLEALVFLNRRLTSNETSKIKSGSSFESRNLINKHFTVRKTLHDIHQPLPNTGNPPLKSETSATFNNIGPTEELPSLLTSILEKFSQSQSVLLESLVHPCNPDLKPVALYDLIPLKQPHVTSLLTLDSDFPGKQSSGFVNSVFVKSDKLVDISYSQYVPFVSKLTDNKDHSSPPSQTVGYEWNRNYEQVFSSSENTNPALLILPSKEDSSPNPIATIEQISQRISLKRKRAILSSSGPESVQNRGSIKINLIAPPTTSPNSSNTPTNYVSSNVEEYPSIQSNDVQ